MLVAVVVGHVPLEVPELDQQGGEEERLLVDGAALLDERPPVVQFASAPDDRDFVTTEPPSDHTNVE